MPSIGLFIVVPDTNSLYTKKIAQVVSGGFTKLLRQHQEVADIRLLVPEIVREELLFQRVQVARRSRDNASRNLSTIAEVTGTRIPRLRSDRDIIMRIRRAFGKWIRDSGAKVVPTPVARIKWRRLITAAAWRLPPFEFIEKDENLGEKGFRDSLILETLCEICRTNPESAVVFLCNDAMLQQAFARRIKANEKRMLFNSLKDFGSYLTLVKESHDRAYSQRLLANAKKKFFQAEDPSSAYIVLNVEQEITTRFWSALNFPPEKPLPFKIEGVDRILPVVTYMSKSQEKSYVGDTYAERVEGDRWVWRTRIQRVGLFAPISSSSGNPFLGMTEKIRITDIDILWSAHTTATAQLENLKLVDVILVSNELQALSVHQRLQFGFPLFQDGPAAVSWEAQARGGS